MLSTSELSFLRISMAILLAWGCVAVAPAQAPLEGLPTRVPPGSAGQPNAGQPNAGQASVRAGSEGGPAEAERPSLASRDRSAPSVAELNVENLTQRMEQVSANTNLEEDTKQALLQLYQQALSDLKAANQAGREIELLSTASQSAAESLERAREEHDRLAANKPEVNTEDSLEFEGFEQARQKLQELNRRLQATTELRTNLSEQISAREKRRKELPQLLSDARKELEQLSSEGGATQDVAPGTAGEAQQWAQEARRRRLREEIRKLDAEQAAYLAEAPLLPVLLENAETREKRLAERVKRVSDAFAEIRESRILSLRARLFALLGKLPGENDEQIEEVDSRMDAWLDLASKQSHLEDSLATAREELELWRERQRKMVARVEPPLAKAGREAVSGFNSFVGLMLRKQRGELPNPIELRSRIDYFQQETQRSDALLFELEEKLQAVDRQLEGLRLSESDSNVPQRDTLNDPQAVRIDYLETMEESLRQFRADLNRYSYTLFEIADVKDSTLQLTVGYREFIDKHILWIRSTDPLDLTTDGKQAVAAFNWLVAYENWRLVVDSMVRDARGSPVWYLLFAVAWLVLIGNQRRLRRVLKLRGEEAAKRNCVEFRLTAESLLLTWLISLPVPTILLFFSWRIDQAWDFALLMENEFPKAISGGLFVGSLVFWPLEFLRQVCRTKGLAEMHFEWPADINRTLSSNLRWFIDVAIPVALLIGALNAQSNARWEAALGRLAFIALMPLMAIFYGRIFHPRGSLLAYYLQDRQGGWIDRLKVVWYPAMILGPLVLAVFSGIGYHYTAVRITQHLNSTLWMIVLLILVYFLCRRWLLLSRRQIMIAQARQRLEDAAKRDPDEASVISVDEPEINLVEVNEQTQRLVTSLVVTAGLVAAYLVWQDVLPAVSLLRSFDLWNVEGATPEQSVVITLGDVVLLIPVIVLVTIATRNVPGLMEIAILQHLPITYAARYAITTLSRYVIIAFGIIYSGVTLGLQWSSIQWLVAALGVGLGFGLQEIFANFVSGIILLFEQPIRVGDIITLDGTTGTVSRIRMRATTITNWDRQELVIPNKSLITGTLLNWTLTDSTNRIVLNVGVAYGSDTDRACELIYQVCEEHDNVMKDPLPLVTFEGFGDNSLSIVLRAYLDSLDFRLQTVHELHSRIYKALNDEGIEIAFPQRDIHVRSFPETLARLFGGEMSRGDGNAETVSSRSREEHSLSR